MNRPFAPACERNAGPILDCLQRTLAKRCNILEIGSGTGQHAAWFMRKKPGWSWQCSDQASNLEGIQVWLNDLGRDDIQPPIALDVTQPNQWPTRRFDAVFSSNTLHIMPWVAVQQMFANLPAVLQPGGSLLIYGPFNQDRQFTSASNAEFDAWLKARDPHQGLRDLQDVDTLAQAAGLEMQSQTAMPANNLLVHWRRNR